MKINDQVNFISTSGTAGHPVETQDFEQWIKSPTKQSSGDEYYWQHQEQLQQSSLRFDEQTGNTHGDALFLNAEPHQETSHLSECSIISSAPLEEDVIPSVEQIKNTLTARENSIQINTCFVKATNTLINEHHYILNQTTETADEKPIFLSSKHKSDLQVFKNHHLFIAGEEAEFTLNAKELNQKEQQELTTMLKNHLKQKGITLKQLMINGVTND